MLLKEEISQLRQDKSKLTRFLDDTRRELGALKQANIVSQMMESHLLRSATDVETDSVKVEVGSVHGSTAAMSELEEAEAKQEQPGWDNDSQFEGAEDSSANELAGGEGEAAAAAAAAFGGFGDEDNDGWGDGWEEEGADTGASQPKQEPDAGAVPIKKAQAEPGTSQTREEPKTETMKASVEEEEDDGWGNWGDEEEEAEQPPEEKQSRQVPQESGGEEGWGGWGEGEGDGEGGQDAHAPADEAHQPADNPATSGDGDGWGGWGDDDGGSGGGEEGAKEQRSGEGAWGGWGDDGGDGGATAVKKEEPPAPETTAERASPRPSPRQQQPDSLISATTSERLEDDGWGDDGWAGFDQEQLGENLRLTARDACVHSSNMLIILYRN